jgi:hypothetical protein
MQRSKVTPRAILGIPIKGYRLHDGYYHTPQVLIYSLALYFLGIYRKSEYNLLQSSPYTHLPPGLVCGVSQACSRLP